MTSPMMRLPAFSVTFDVVTPNEGTAPREPVAIEELARATAYASFTARFEDWVFDVPLLVVSEAPVVFVVEVVDVCDVPCVAPRETV